MRKTVYNGNTAFEIPDIKPTKSWSVWETGARRLIDINNGEVTPFSLKYCNNCNRELWRHWQLPLYSQKVSKWFCYRDGTSYSWGNHVRI